MDQQLLEMMKGKSREERAAFFESHKSELLSDAALNAVNGGGTTNPGSSVPDGKGNYWTSWGFVCKGSHFCG